MRTLGVLAGIALLVILTGSGVGWLLVTTLTFAQHSSHKAQYEERKHPIVIAGSGNVYPWLLDHHRDTLAQTEAIWLDLGSSRALENVFALFDYGHSTVKPRMGFVAMTSDGLASLRKLFRKMENDQPDLTKENYWLAIEVARPPLAVMYRSNGADQLHFGFVDSPKFPTGSLRGPVPFVTLKDFLSMASEPSSTKSPHPTIYLPSEDSGTRETFETAAHKTLPIKTQVPDRLELLYGHNSFVSLESYPQVLASESLTPLPNACDRLKEISAQMALICETADCSKIVTTEYYLVFKIKLLQQNEFQLTEPSERVLASAVDPLIKSDGVVRDTPYEDHIIEHPLASDSLPNYFSCSQSQGVH